MSDVINIFDRLAAPLRKKILEREIKLLKAEASKKPKKAEKHADKLLRLELELRQLKDKYKLKH